mgnify:CR=1 FL=1
MVIGCILRTAGRPANFDRTTYLLPQAGLDFKVKENRLIKFVTMSGMDA